VVEDDNSSSFITDAIDIACLAVRDDDAAIADSYVIIDMSSEVQKKSSEKFVKLCGGLLSEIGSLCIDKDHQCSKEGLLMELLIMDTRIDDLLIDNDGKIPSLENTKKLACFFPILVVRKSSLLTNLLSVTKDKHIGE
jgi:hypothetical protein